MKPLSQKKMNTIPPTLEEAIKHLISEICVESQIKIMEMGEDEFVDRSHFGSSLNLRNEWGLWFNENDLSRWFFSIGIEHADDRSSIIMTSLYRTLVGKPIDLDSQIKMYVEYWSNF